MKHTAERSEQKERGWIDQLRVVVAETSVPHVMSDPGFERGGFLIGSAPDDESGFPETSQALRAKHAIEKETRLTFTQATWHELFSELERLADAGEPSQVVGWYHSHPSGAIFLSTHDEFIHRNFFAAVHQIAIVINPSSGNYGVFVWENREIIHLFDVPEPADP